MWKRIQQFGLLQRYNDDQDQEFALNLRMSCATAFPPPAQVIEGFENLADNLRNLYGDEVDELLEYFEDNYAGRFRRNAPRRPPLFALDLWNMFHRTDDELPQTNTSTV